MGFNNQTMPHNNDFNEVYIDPVIAQAFNYWKKQLTYFTPWLALFVIFSYFITKKVLMPELYFPLQLSFWIIFLLALKIDQFFAHIFAFLIALHKNLRPHTKSNLNLWGLWAVSLIMASKVGWFSLNFDPGTILFLSYLPAVWLFKIPRTVNGLLALSVLVFIPILLIGNYEKTAEIFAVIVYFLLVTATIQGFIELKFKSHEQAA